MNAISPTDGNSNTLPVADGPAVPLKASGLWPLSVHPMLLMHFVGNGRYFPRQEIQQVVGERT